jgi:hypothetical protein
MNPAFRSLAATSPIGAVAKPIVKDPGRQTIFRLLYQEFGRKLGNMAKGNHRAPAVAGRPAVEPGSAARV